MMTFICRTISFSAKAATIALVFCLLACLGVTKIMWLNYFPPFMFQYFIGAAVLALVFLGLRNLKWLLLCAFLTCATGYEYIAANNLLSSPPSVVSDDSYALKIISFNQLRYNKHIGTFLSRPDVQSADVIVLLEANKHSKESAQKLKNIFPHQFMALGLSSKSMIVLSKYPLEKLERIRMFEDDPAENFIVHFDVTPDTNNTPTRIIALHTKAPIPYRRIAERNTELARLSEVINNAPKDRPIIALGDFNITPYNLNFKNLLKQTGLTSLHSVYAPPVHSWPSFAPWVLRFQIDHILINSRVQPISLKAIKADGSDHLALSGSFAIE